MATPSEANTTTTPNKPRRLPDGPNTPSRLCPFCDPRWSSPDPLSARRFHENEAIYVRNYTPQLLQHLKEYHAKTRSFDVLGKHTIINIRHVGKRNFDCPVAEPRSRKRLYRNMWRMRIGGVVEEWGGGAGAGVKGWGVVDGG